MTVGAWRLALVDWRVALRVWRYFVNLGAKHYSGVQIRNSVALMWRLCGAAGNVALVPFLAKRGLPRTCNLGDTLGGKGIASPELPGLGNIAESRSLWTGQVLPPLNDPPPIWSDYVSGWLS